MDVIAPEGNSTGRTQHTPKDLLEKKIERNTTQPVVQDPCFGKGIWEAKLWHAQQSFASRAINQSTSTTINEAFSLLLPTQNYKLFLMPLTKIFHA